MFCNAIRFIGILLIFFVAVPIASHAGAQNSMGADIVHAIVVDVEEELEISFDSGDHGAYSVNVTEAEALSSGKVLSRPALIRVTGATVEVVIDVEENKIYAYDGDSKEVVSVFNFNVEREDVGSSVSLMPFSENDFFTFSIGGVVKGENALGKFYTGANVLNINYL